MAPLTYAGQTLNQILTTGRDFPLASSAAALTLAAGTIALGYKLIHHLSANSNPVDAADQAKIDRQNRIKEVLGKLLITEYHLPTDQNEKTEWSSTNRPRPIFDEKTKKEIAIIGKMIEKAIQNKSPLPNIILKGPAGVGKTMLAEALCQETGTGFIRIPSGTMEKHIKLGNHITAFRDVVKIAEEECYVPVFLIMDDGEELVAQRSDINNPNDAKSADTTKAPWLVEPERLSRTITQRRNALVNAILEESGKTHRRKLGFCITTNRSEVIDPAFVTRSRILSIEAPTQEERKQIIITHLPTIFKFDNNFLSFFNKGRLEDMASRTEGFTGRNIVKMLEDIFACVQLENGDITQDVIDASILAMRASVEKADSRKPSILASIRQLGKSILNAIAA